MQQLLHLPWPVTAASLSCEQPTAAAANAGCSTASLQSAAAIASCLALLQQLVASHAAAGAMLASALQSCPELASYMAAGLNCGLEAIVVPLLQ
jgi:hypothetical protein